MFIFSNLAISLDGKISTTDRSLAALGSSYDRKNMIALRGEADAILCGADTLRTYKKPLTAKDTEEQPHNIILSSRLKEISQNWPFFRRNDIRRILFVSHLTRSTDVRRFQKSCEVVVLKKSKTAIARQICAYLSKIGVQRLLIEGGGAVMWEFSKANLIDEFHVTLTPQIVGGKEAPTLVDGAGFSAKKLLKLKLSQCRIVDQELFLIYRR
jgi:riboflavin-specific deaminase-like protein